ncbi:MAG: hypothetical protein K8R89_03625 [Anaerolineae bacterium]|nr:hypothetical protein [Anaerolineae bacterium]
MHPHRFVELVRTMRVAQKDYFATRTRTALSEAKRLEKKVDARLLQFIHRQQAEQHALFLWEEKGDD